jgi:hypothetical protein
MVLVWVDVFFVEKSFPFEQFVRNGSLMFFATAVVASVTLVHILSKKFSNHWNWNLFEIFTPKNWNLFEIFTLFIFPLVILMICVIFFYLPYFQSEIKIELLQTAECYILLTTLIYSFFVKFFAFK